MKKHSIEKNLKRAVTRYCKCVEFADNVIIAGGFIRAFHAGENPADLDLYFESEQRAVEFELLLEIDNWKKVFETSRAVSYRKGFRKVQVIKFVYGNPEAIIGHFDFSVCQAAFEFKDEDMCIHDEFFEHLAARILVFNDKTLAPLSSLKRVFKYVKRGYSICDENIIKISEAIARAINFDKPEEVAAHIDGLDPEGGSRIRMID